MATYTVKIAGTCAGGGHIGVDLYRDGLKIGSRCVPREAVLSATLEVDELLPALLRLAALKAGAMTLAQAKAAVEAAAWVM